MSIFKLRDLVVDEYRQYVQSFLSIHDHRIRDFVSREVLQKGALWPEALIQINPAYEKGPTVQDLVLKGRLHPVCGDIFRDGEGKPFTLFRHQEEAIAHGLAGRHFIVTSGTGSGKSLTYFIPIFDAILRGDPSENKVWAIIVYPMNALVNSQYYALTKLAENYHRRGGQDMPVRFEKYTGQDREKREEIQKNPPHILLTNYVMLELMLLRPEEHNFVDRTTSNLRYLVIDELHTYRGRQGADMAMLIRRLRERCGNPDLITVGTSATMVVGEGMSGEGRRRAVAGFASKLFGVEVTPDQVIEEYLVRSTDASAPKDPRSLRQAILDLISHKVEDLRKNPLLAWVEETMGLREDEEGKLRRSIPISLEEASRKLREITGLEGESCAKAIQEMLLKASEMRNPDGSPFMSFKLHQFIAQGHRVLATLEPRDQRVLSAEGVYYGRKGSKDLPLYPLVFCRSCGMDYYEVYRDFQGNFLPLLEFESISEEDAQAGYLMIPSEEETEWSLGHLPEEWLDEKGRVKSSFRPYVPQPLWVMPDGTLKMSEEEGTVKAWFQPHPFHLCLFCGEFFTGREREFRKLSGLSSSGRSTATTVLSISAVQKAHRGNIEESARKILSFTDNRQDASLQAGHFNDFVKAALLRSAIYDAVQMHDKLRFDEVADKVAERMGLEISDVAQNKEIDPDSAQARQVWKIFKEVLEYRIYEDLRRGWRLIWPNLENCGLLRIYYFGLDELCRKEEIWKDVPEISKLDPEQRLRELTVFLDHIRKKLAIKVGCLEEVNQQQLRRRAGQVLDPKWGFGENEFLYRASRFLLPGAERNIERGFRLSERSQLGRFLRRKFNLGQDYERFVAQLVDVLCAHGILRRGEERGVDYVQIDASCIVWSKGSGVPPDDPLYSRRASGDFYKALERKANQYFTMLYKEEGRHFSHLEGREHTAQITYENRLEREERFRKGELPCLFCSPTMELGIDISDLRLVHMRNVPPTPANYAQRSGRAGRQGEPALVFTYCLAQSGHDQYYFRHREEMVAGAVRLPHVDLGNENLIKAHVQSIWLAATGLSLGHSISEILELSLEGYPLKEEVQSHIQLSDSRFEECLREAERVLKTCYPDLEEATWFTDQWVTELLRRAPKEFDRAFDRFRELFKAADRQWEEANQRLRYGIRDPQERSRAEQERREAERQKSLLFNQGTTFQESDFYPYRYLASEGFLPGYNFPRLPLRAFLAGAGEAGEYISRPRFIALSEFGPHSLIYHEGTKYRVEGLIPPPGGLESLTMMSKLCRSCGYFNNHEGVDLCALCGSKLDASSCDIARLLAMPNVKAWKRERITCDEEDRLRGGYKIELYFRFAPDPGGRERKEESLVYDSEDHPLLKLVYAPSATLYLVNHGWRRSQEQGFLLDKEGRWVSGSQKDEDGPVEFSPHQVQRVRLYVQDTHNLLLIYPESENIAWKEDILPSLQYALKRGIGHLFQVEEDELLTQRVGADKNRAILFYEAAEGGFGVLRQLVEKEDVFSRVAEEALRICHFDPETLEDVKPDCVRACHECLLSYYNQLDYPAINRFAIKDLLSDLIKTITRPLKAGRDYEAHYRWLYSLTDSRSDLERRFVSHLYRTKRRLPADAQARLPDHHCIPDFFYHPNVCVFCDGSVHDTPDQRRKDELERQELRELGYRVIVIRYDQDLEERIASYPEVFGEGTRG
ncbi:MAG: DEAD/DEAH box helicase [Actinomycetota bacterium]